MESFASYLSSFRVKEGQTGVFWLGQAGFVFKRASGEMIAVVRISPTAVTAISASDG